MLKTQRLYLRRFLESDADDIYEYLSSPEVTKYEPYHPKTLEESIEIAKDRSTDDRFLAICLQENNKVIGNIYLAKQEPDYIDTFSLGYVMNPNYQKKGYATEASNAILDYVFHQKNAHRVVAHCNVLNENSWRLLERLKLRREATMRQNIYFKLDESGNPIWSDSYMYAILKEEYCKE